jgi:predicted transcriptional regulator of viral defense system
VLIRAPACASIQSMPPLTAKKRGYDTKPRSVEAAVAGLAARQHGIATRRQLLELGLSRDGIRRRLEMARLHPVHAGVYSVGHPLLSLKGRWIAAVLACGTDALLSHRSAAAHHGIAEAYGRDIDVLVPGRKVSPRRGIRVHCVRSFDAQDRAVRHGIPLTSVARTLFDLAEVVNARQLRNAWMESERQRLLDIRQVQRLCDGARGRRGTGTCRELLADRSEPPDVRSKFELRFPPFCDDYAIRRPAFNVAIGPYVVDALWVRERLVVELDSRAFHNDPAAFERDRKRDADLQVWGYRVIRITWRRLVNEPAAVARDIKALLRLAQI